MFTGRVEVICGGMFAGKTEELSRRLRRAIIGNQNVHVFKHVLDDRYDDSCITDHNGNKLSSTPVRSVEEIHSTMEKLLSPDLGTRTVVGIDEVQFFQESVVQVVEMLANRGCRVIVAGLDMDYRGKEFGPIGGLMAIADDVKKVHAVCARCGEMACKTFRLRGGNDTVQPGGAKDYEPRCRECYNKG
jgi:thymidine kinase